MRTQLRHLKEDTEQILSTRWATLKVTNSFRAR
ncbi:Uncharacterised protein [Sphingobacterium multivorum]|uniref:Uncharacterized protein n=1 Tax=Sphingobacterium multivorum TaxID=28454 RepID=A0A2X2JLA3_SPHMU|nr:Uncharacterised protein [Sphingobacterium multivorum]